MRACPAEIFEFSGISLARQSGIPHPIRRHIPQIVRKVTHGPAD
jgi:hypothetical protein